MMYMTKAYAKINLGLKIVGKDPADGYHYLDMVTVPLELHDRIEIEKMPESYDTIVTCDDMDIPTDESNTVSKALKIMREKYAIKAPLRIHIHKMIPLCAGLGGGSADAAAVMVELNKIFKCKATTEELCALGIKVGSDVPLCIMNKPCHTLGKGEEVHEIKMKKEYNVLLCKPSTGLSTRDVYKKYDEMKEELPYSISKLMEGLASDDMEMIRENIGNDLQKPAIALNKDIGIIIEDMKESGAEYVFMTGSGACVCALSKNRKKLAELQEKLIAKGMSTELTKTL